MTRSVMVLLLATSALLGGATALVTPDLAWAQEEIPGVPVKVIVYDPEGKPVPTAVVRHPQEADRHRVNTFDGSWEASVLYLPDGTELKFLNGMVLELEISAPGYVNQRIQYLVRKRKNVVEVQLARMEFSMEEEEADDPVIQFGRDKPIDGQAAEPAH